MVYNIPLIAYLCLRSCKKVNFGVIKEFLDIEKRETFDGGNLRRLLKKRAFRESFLASSSLSNALVETHFNTELDLEKCYGLNFIFIIIF